MAVTDYINDQVYNNQVVVFSKSWCPYCEATKKTFRSLPAQTKVIELDETNDGDAIQMELYRMTGQRTVPNVWVKGQFIGGNSETQRAAATGRLHELLS